MKAKPKRYKQALQVILGSQTIKAFVASPKEFKVIGIVRMGLEFGLLAVTAAGNYVRVNGSKIEALSNAAVEDAISLARTTGRGESYAESRSHAMLAPPTVFVRKRRKIPAELVELTAVLEPIPLPVQRQAPLHMPLQMASPTATARLPLPTLGPMVMTVQLPLPISVNRATQSVTANPVVVLPSRLKSHSLV